MATLKDKEHHESQFDWETFTHHVINVYGNMKQPNYSFAYLYFKEQKYPKILEFIKNNYQFTEDTEPNTDISYGYILEKNGEKYVLQVSFVGPYFYLSKIIPSLGQSEPDYCLVGSWSSLFSYMGEAGFIFTSKEVLSRKISFGDEEMSVYAILYSYADEPPWVDR